MLCTQDTSVREGGMCTLVFSICEAVLWKLGISLNYLHCEQRNNLIIC